MSLTTPLPGKTEFRVDVDRHEYWLGDRQLPSVTDILEDEMDFSRVANGTLEYKKAIGQAVHGAIALGETLDPDSVDPAIIGFLNAYQKFMLENDVEIIERNRPGFHPLYQFAGTWDEVWRYQGELAMPDIKTVYTMHPATELQTSAYCEIRNHDSRAKIKRRFGLQLGPDGTYKLHEYKGKDDFRVFLALLTRFNWRIKHGLTSRAN